MAFLKHFYAEGFKSFAHPINLDFEENMIGIVGPNGSGKSNIVDALKWTIGEQSIKTLRGKEKSNLIFSGSQDLNEAEFAMVSLTFDNTSRILHYDNDTVKVTRKLLRKTGESFFYINDDPARLKDIHDIFLDTGLSKGSLGIISQGTVSWFAEAKPEDRRKMFEEAAGIGRYTKKKNESLDALEKAKSNLELLSTHIYQMDKDIRNLEKQSENVRLYKEKMSLMEKLDVSVAVQDILTWKDEIVDKEKIRDEFETKYKKALNDYNEKFQLSEEANKQFKEYDNKLNVLNEQREKISKRLSLLQVQKAKHEKNSEELLKTDNLANKIQAYTDLISNAIAEVQIIQKNLTNLEIDVENQKQELNIIDQKVRELEAFVKNKEREVVNLQAEVRVYENQLANPGEIGVKTILRHKESLPGVYGTVAQLIKVDSEYELAIQVALGKTVSNIVVDNENNAHNAINFLKNNRSGRATFYPLDKIKPRSLKPETYDILSQVEGYINTANNLINIEDNFRIVADNLLGNVIIADSLEHAKNISNLTYQAYRVITLEGDSHNVGGSITGGSAPTQFKTSFNLEDKIKERNETIAALNSEIEQKRNELNALLLQKNNLSNTCATKDRNLFLERNNLTTKENNIQNWKNEFQALTQTNFDDTNEIVNADTLSNELLELETNEINIRNKIEEVQNSKTYYSDAVDKLKYELNDLSVIKDNSSSHLNSLNTKLINMKNDLEATENRLSTQYKLTVEMAIEKYSEPLEMELSVARMHVKRLNAEIASLGTINFQAVEDLEKKQKERQIMQTDYDNVKQAVEQMEDIIAELDKKAKSDFSNIIKKVNEIMPAIFQDLFGGGECSISYTDPNNILESGIEVSVRPPGKKISNLVLLSGGEKTLVALSVLFALLKSSSFPLVVLDEAEAALDQYNVDIFAKIIKDYSDSTQFLIITHRPGTMKICDSLYGTTMQNKGVTRVVKTDLEDIKNKYNLNETKQQSEGTN